MLRSRAVLGAGVLEAATTSLILGFITKNDSTFIERSSTGVLRHHHPEVIE